MNRETNFWGRIVEGLWKPDRLLNRIENGVLDGMPDTYVCIEGSMNWIELKCPAEPKRSTTALFSGAHQLSIAQRNWLLMHRQAGGRGWVGIETEGWVLLIGAQHADLINKLPIAELVRISAFAQERPMKDGWTAFVAALTRKGTP